MSEDINPKKRGLGRGLDAIFGEDEIPNVSRETLNDVEIKEDNVPSVTDVTLDEDLGVADDEPVLNSSLPVENGEVSEGKRRSLPVEWIRACDFQPRKYFNQDALEDLAKSIAMHGVLQPIVVRPIIDEDNAYEIIAGERRWRASQMVQLHEIPVVIQYLDDDAVLEIALIENLQRENLTPIEEAQAYRDLMDRFGHTQEKLSVTVGKSRSYLANMLRLLDLPESVQAFVNEGKITSGHARNLVGHPDAEALAKQIVDENLSVRAVENLIREGKTGDVVTAPKAKKDKTVDKGVNTVALEEEMTRILGVNVTIDPSQKNPAAGQIKIDYQTLDQLDDVLQRLSKASLDQGDQ